LLFITARFAGLPAWPVVTAVFIGLGVAAGGCAPERPRPDVLGLASAASGVGGAIVFETSEGPLDVSDAVEDPLTLPRALRLALGADPDVQAALARVRSAEAEADQSRLLPNPILSVAFRVPTGGGKSIIEAGLTEDFVALLTRPGRSEAADHRLRAAAADAVTAVLDATAEVRERYAAVQSLDALTPVLDERRSLIARLIELARDRLNAGEGTRLDLTTLESQRLELEVEIAERQLELRQERLTLARLLGRPSAPPRWKLTAWEGFPPTAAGEDAWVSAALARRPEVESGRWELAALGVEQRLARYAPFDGAGAGVDAERDADWSVGPAVTAPLPVFDWGQARRAKAEASRVEARHRLTKVRRRIVEEVRRSYAEFEATRSTLDLVRAQLLPAQQRRRAETEAAYQAGQTDVTTLILADQDLQATRAKLIELQRKTSSALIRLERAVGGPVAAAEAEKRSSATRPATTRPQD
jgi:outer membrane protein TolC